MNQVWTIQPLLVWERLQEERVLLVDESLADISWVDSYDWMRERMRERLPGNRGLYPWWAWYAPKPDLRRIRHHVNNERGKPYVRIELSLPDERVLISHLDAWVHVINGWIVPYTYKESLKWMDWVDTFEGGPLPEGAKAMREATWPRIFERDLPARGREDRDGLESSIWVEDYWQATFEELRMDDVQKVTHFLSG